MVERNMERKDGEMCISEGVGLDSSEELITI
jgi:hypothetical protein